MLFERSSFSESERESNRDGDQSTFSHFLYFKAPALQNLSEIPVFSKERRISEAYMLRGGRDAAQEEMRKIKEEEEREHEEQWEWFHQMIEIKKEKINAN